MTNSEAVKQVLSDYNSRYDSDNCSIVVRDVTPALLKEMINDCKSHQYIEEVINFYDDDEDDTFCNWQDVEGEGYGWLWVDKPESMWHQLVVDSMTNYIRYIRKNHSDNMKCVIMRLRDNTITYHFVEREEEMRDQLYTFSDKKISV